MIEADRLLIEQFIREAKSLFDRGYATGAAGNMSALLSDNTVVATPSGASLGNLDINTISICSIDGELISGLKPTKELKFHLEIYKNNKALKAIVHLHSTYCTALSCIKDLNKDDVLPAVTPYVLMRMGHIPLVPYFKPGSDEIGNYLGRIAKDHNAFLLANHGPITCGRTIKEAVDNAEEFEASAKVYITLKQANVDINYISEDEIKLLRGY